MTVNLCEDPLNENKGGEEKSLGGKGRGVCPSPIPARAGGCPRLKHTVEKRTSKRDPALALVPRLMPLP